MQRLLPLDDRENRIPFLSTQSDWTAVITNSQPGSQGQDADAVSGFTLSERIKIKLRPADIFTPRKNGGHVGGMRWFSYGNPGSRFDCFPSRTFYAAQGESGPRWKKFEDGIPLAFENEKDLSEARKNMFPAEYIRWCAAQMGIDFENPSFYLNRGILLTKFCGPF